MPRYDYKCYKCGRTKEIFRSMKANERIILCQCKSIMKRVFSPPNLITDTNFVGTGRYDNRVCVNRDDKIEGRKDWKRRLQERNLQEVDISTLSNQKQVKPKLVFEGE